MQKISASGSDSCGFDAKTSSCAESAVSKNNCSVASTSKKHIFISIFLLRDDCGDLLDCWTKPTPDVAHEESHGVGPAPIMCRTPAASVKATRRIPAFLHNGQHVDLSAKGSFREGLCPGKPLGG